MDIVHKQVSLVHHVPSSESFQAYLLQDFSARIANPDILAEIRTKTLRNRIRAAIYWTVMFSSTKIVRLKRAGAT
jgi:ribosomal protein S17E